MILKVSNAAPADPPDTGAQLSPEDRRALDAMLDEGPPPVAPLWRDIRTGSVVRRSGQTFWVMVKDGDRVGVMGSCQTCRFPFTFTIDLKNPKPRFPHRCEDHRTLPWARTPKKRRHRYKKRRAKPHVARKWRPDPYAHLRKGQHEVAPRRAAKSRWQRGDLLDKGGHLYLVLCGPRAVSAIESSRHVVLPQLLGVCSTCGEPFRFSTRAEQMDTLSPLMRRRCPRHATAAHRSRPPIPWTGAVLHTVARAAGMSVEELIGTGAKDASVREALR